MSDEEIILAHDSYVESNNINVNDLPKNLTDQYDEIDGMIDAYEEDQNENKTTTAIESASLKLKNEIEAWHRAELSKPTPPANSTPNTPPITINQTQQPIVPLVEKEEEEEHPNGGWGLNTGNW